MGPEEGREKEEEGVTYRYVEPGLAQMLTLSLEHLLQQKADEWKRELSSGRLTTEMRDVFVGLGWLSSSRDSRLQDEPPSGSPDAPKEEAPQGRDVEAVEIREPKVRPGKPEEPSLPNEK